MVRFWEYCNKHKISIFVSTIVLGLVHGSRFFTNNVSIDTVLFVKNPGTDYNWLEIGRWGMVLTKKLGGLGIYNPYVASVFAFLMMVLSCILWSYLFFEISKKDRESYFLVGILFFSHPVFALQIFFQIQAFELLFSIALIPITLLFVYKWIDGKKWLWCILSVFLMVWIFATYQSNVVLYIAGAIVCFILYEEKDIKSLLINGIKLVVSFFIGYLSYNVIDRLFFPQSEYLESSVFWGQLPFKECLDFIWLHIQQVIYGSGTFFNKCYILWIGIFAFIFVLELKHITWYKVIKWCAIAILFLTPFALTIYLGHMPVERSQTSLGFVQAVVSMMAYQYFKSQKIQIVQKGMSIIVLASAVLMLNKQMYTTLKLYYTDDVRYNEDVNTIQQILNDVNDIKGIDAKPLVFIGTKDSKLNASCYQAGSQGIEYFGESCTKLFYDVEPYYFNSTYSILDLCNVIGMPYPMPSETQVIKARKDAELMPCWPSEGSVKDSGETIIIKLSDDNLPTK